MSRFYSSLETSGDVIFAGTGYFGGLLVTGDSNFTGGNLRVTGNVVFTGGSFNVAGGSSQISTVSTSINTTHYGVFVDSNVDGAHIPYSGNSNFRFNPNSGLLTIGDLAFNSGTVTGVTTINGSNLTIAGGTTTTSVLTLKPTTASGVAGANILFKVGNNGENEVLRITNERTIVTNGSNNTLDYFGGVPGNANFTGALTVGGGLSVTGALNIIGNSNFTGGVNEFGGAITLSTSSGSGNSLFFKDSDRGIGIQGTQNYVFTGTNSGGTSDIVLYSTTGPNARIHIGNTMNKSGLSAVPAAIVLENNLLTVNGNATFSATGIFGGFVQATNGFRVPTNSGSLNFNGTSGQTKIIAINDSSPNDNTRHDFYGFGTASNTLRYQSSFGDHKFFSATSSSTSNELFRIYGTGKVATSLATGGDRNVLDDGLGNAIFSGTGVFSGFVQATKGFRVPANSGSLNFNETIQNKIISIYDVGDTTDNTRHDYYGFGINSNVFRHHVNQTASSYKFFASTSSSTSNELFRIYGTGKVATSLVGGGDRNILDDGSGNANITGTLTVVGLSSFTGGVIVTGNANFTGGNMTIAGVITGPLNVSGFITSSVGGFRVPTNAGSLNFNETIQNKIIALWDNGVTTDNTRHNYYGFGIAANILRYQTALTSTNHVFYAATSSTASNELFRIYGTGKVATSLAAGGDRNVLDDGSGNANITGALNVVGNVTLNTGSSVTLGISASDTSKIYFTNVNRGIGSNSTANFVFTGVASGDVTLYTAQNVGSKLHIGNTNYPTSANPSSAAIMLKDNFPSLNALSVGSTQYVTGTASQNGTTTVTGTGTSFTGDMVGGIFVATTGPMGRITTVLSPTLLTLSTTNTFGDNNYTIYYNGLQSLSGDLVALSDISVINNLRVGQYGGNTNNAKELIISYDTVSNFGQINSLHQNTGFTPLKLNPNGGSVVTFKNTLDDGLNGNATFASTGVFGGFVQATKGFRVPTNSGSLNFNTTTQNKIIALFDSGITTDNTRHDFVGFGIGSGLRYQTNDVASSHTFYSTITTSTSRTNFTINGSGVVTTHNPSTNAVQNTLDDGLGNATFAATGTFNGGLRTLGQYRPDNNITMGGSTDGTNKIIFGTSSTDRALGSVITNAGYFGSTLVGDLVLHGTNGVQSNIYIGKVNAGAEPAIKVMNGLLVVTGDHNFTGGTHVVNGSSIFTGGTHLVRGNTNFTGGNVTVAGTFTANGTLSFTGDLVVPADKSIIFTSGSTTESNKINFATSTNRGIGSVAVSGNIFTGTLQNDLVLYGTSGFQSDIYIGQTPGATTSNGTVQGSTVPAIKISSNLLTVNGNSNFTGGNIINAGNYILFSGNSVGTSIVGLQFNDSGHHQLNATNTLAINDSAGANTQRLLFQQNNKEYGSFGHDNLVGFFLKDSSDRYIFTGSTGAFSSRNNTLDDGSGNMTVAGTFTPSGSEVQIGYNSSNRLAIGDTILANVIDAGTVARIASGSSSRDMTLQLTKTGVETAIHNVNSSSYIIGVDNALPIVFKTAMSTVANPISGSGTTRLTIANSGSITTTNNTLDDGLGNATFARTGVFGGFVQSTTGGFRVPSNAGSLNFNETIQNKIVSLYDAGSTTDNTRHDYFGFGIASGTLRYQVDSTSLASHKFFAATSSSASNELFRIYGSGKVATSLAAGGDRNILDDGSGNMNITGTFTCRTGGSFGGAITMTQTDTGPNEIFFTDNGQIRSYDNAHRIIFDRANDILETREYGAIILSSGATSFNRTQTVYVGSDQSTTFASTVTSNGIGFRVPSNSGSLNFNQTIQNKIIALYDAGTTTDNTRYDFVGFGVSSSTLRYNVGSTTNTHKFFAATSSSASNELFQIYGSGKVATSLVGGGDRNILDDGSGNMNITGTLTVVGNATLSNNLTVAATGVFGGFVQSTTGGFRVSTNGGSLNFNQTVQNKIISMFDAGVTTDNTRHDYYGFGVSAGILRYHIQGTADAHIFYAATSGSTSNELARISGIGNLTVAATGSFGGGLSVSNGSNIIGNANFTGGTMLIAGATTIISPLTLTSTSPGTLILPTAQASGVVWGDANSASIGRATSTGDWVTGSAVGDICIRPENTKKIFLGSNGSANLIINTSTGTVTTPFNTLDNGAGNLTIAGTGSFQNIAVSNNIVVAATGTYNTIRMNQADSTSGTSYAGSNQIFFADNGQISSNDQAHRLIFDRSNNILELREFGNIVLSAGSNSTQRTNTVIVSTGSTTFASTGAFGGDLSVGGGTTFKAVKTSKVVTTTFNTLDDGLGNSTFAGTGTFQNIAVGNNIVIGGNLTVNGTTTTINSSNVSVTDNIIEMAQGNTADTLDSGYLGIYSTTLASGIIRDASDSGIIKVINGATLASVPYADYSSVLGDIQARRVLAVNAIVSSTGAFGGDLTAGGGTNFKVVKATGVVTTTNNTLDDGNGNIIINGVNSAAIQLPISNDSGLSWGVDSGTNASIGRAGADNSYFTGTFGGDLVLRTTATKSLVIGSSTTGILFKVNSSTNATTTLNNILDDGVGNMVVNGNTFSPLIINNSGSTVVQTQYQVASAIKAYYGWDNTVGVRIANGSGNYILKQASASTSDVSLLSNKNTLDDGVNGNATFAATGIFGGFVQATKGFRVPTDSGSLNFNQTIQNKIIAIFDGGTTTDNTRHDFEGFGIAFNILRYQVATTDVAHTFYSALTSSTSRTNFTINGSGVVTTHIPSTSAVRNTLDDGFGSMTTSNTVYNTGTIAQSGTTVTGTGTTFTADMVGGYIVVSSNYYNERITAFTNATTLTVDQPQTITPTQAYTIYYGGHIRSSGTVFGKHESLDYGGSNSTNSNGGLVAQSISDPNRQVYIGYNVETDKGYIQAIQQGTSYRDLVLNPICNTSSRVLTGNTTGGFRNVLDDGNGNMTVSGSVTSTIGGFRVLSNAGSLNFNTTIQNKIIAIYDPGTTTDNTLHNYYGFGIAENTMRYQVSDVVASHTFYSSLTSSTSRTNFTINGSGVVTTHNPSTSAVQNTLDDGSGNMIVAGAPYSIRLSTAVSSGISWGAGGAQQAIGRSASASAFITGSIAGDACIRLDDTKSLIVGQNSAITFKVDSSTNSVTAFGPITSTTGGFRLTPGTAPGNPTINYGASVAQNKLLAIYDPDPATNTRSDFLGFGRAANQFRYNVGSSSDSHAFFAGTGASGASSINLFTINGSGSVTTHNTNTNAVRNTLDDGLGNATFAGTGTFNGGLRVVGNSVFTGGNMIVSGSIAINTGVTTIRGDIGSTINQGQLHIAGLTNPDKNLVLGYDTTNNWGYIQGVTQAVGQNALKLNPAGAAVSTYRNTLDDGVNGNATFSSTGVFGGFVQATKGFRVPANSGSLNFNQTIQNKIIAIYDAGTTTDNTRHDYDGFGIAFNIMRYQVSDVVVAHTFYSALTTSTSRTNFTINGSGVVTTHSPSTSAVQNTLDDGIGNISTTLTTHSIGSISQSGTTITGTNSAFTSAMVGGYINITTFATARITAVTSATQITVDISQTVPGGNGYTVFYGGNIYPTGIIKAPAISITGILNSVVATITADNSRVMAVDRVSQFAIRGSTDSTQNLYLGYNTTTNEGYIQATNNAADRPLRINPYGGAVSTRNAVLDDGSGNASWALTGVFGGDLTVGANSFTVVRTTKAVSTTYNTLDDGIGNATFARTGSFGGFVQATKGFRVPAGSGSLSFNNTTQNKIIALYDTGDTTDNTRHDYYGFGISSNTLRYHLNSGGASHTFYSTLTSSTSRTMFTINGSGVVTTHNPSTSAVQNTLDDGVGNATFAATGSFGGFVQATNGFRVPSNSGSLIFNETIQNKIIALWDETPTDNTRHDYFGFGITSAILRYHTANTSNDHVFYAGTSSSTSNELARISGIGNLTVAATGTFNGGLRTVGNSVFTGGNMIVTGDVTQTAGNISLSSTTTPARIITASGQFGRSTGGANEYGLTVNQNNDMVWQGNSRLIMVANNGTMANLIMTTGALSVSITGALSVQGMITSTTGGFQVSSNAGSLNFNQTIQNKIIALWDQTPTNNTQHDYNGFGISTNTLRYQVAATTTDHVFYAATSSSGSDEVARIVGNSGGIYLPGTNNAAFAIGSVSFGSPTTNGNYFSDSIAGDAIIRHTTANVLLGSGGGNSAIRINSSNNVSMTGTLTMNKAIIQKISSVSGTSQTLDNTAYLWRFTNAGAIAVTLPLASSNPGLTLLVVNDTATGTVTIGMTSSDTIDGTLTTRVISARYDRTEFVSDGLSIWYSI